MQKTSVRPVMEATTNSKETSSTMCFLLAAERDGHNFRGLSSPNLNLMGGECITQTQDKHLSAEHLELLFCKSVKVRKNKDCLRSSLSGEHSNQRQCGSLG